MVTVYSLHPMGRPQSGGKRLREREAGLRTRESERQKRTETETDGESRRKLQREMEGESAKENETLRRRQSHGAREGAHPNRSSRPIHGTASPYDSLLPAWSSSKSARLRRVARRRSSDSSAYRYIRGGGDRDSSCSCVFVCIYILFRYLCWAMFRFATSCDVKKPKRIVLCYSMLSCNKNGNLARPVHRVNETTKTQCKTGEHGEINYNRTDIHYTLSYHILPCRTSYHPA